MRLATPPTSASSPSHRVIEVGNIVFTPRLQRHPGGTEAMYLMARSTPLN